MFKFAVVIFAVIACAAAKPGLVAPLAYTAPAAVVAGPAGVVTATSSQYIARNHNGIATAPVVAPVAAPVVAKSVAYTAPVAAAYTAPVVAKYAAAYSHPLAYSSPVVAKYATAYSHPLAYSTPVVAKYAAAYSHPLAYSAPLTYAAAPAPISF
ncbi:cuticle protein 16.5-like [Lucilia sericata]|uniref:cuticle protein 16.5-like n=1 Tax=Lucilia sericata TaxID=13632 RepID=UPI0018A82716|nr:cuticle protein 16.5-like [Lucilia sericata]